MVCSIVMLEKEHEIKSFDCGVPALNTWLRTIARQHQKKSLSSTFVLVNNASPRAIIGFYTLAIRGLASIEDLPSSMIKRLPLAVPGITLARLAVAATARKQGHGGILLADAMIRAKRVSIQAGGFALFVDAKDDESANFYAHYGFRPFPGDRLTLCISFASIPDFQ